ncbi:MAG: hypothetical protein KJ971_02410 [Firmicutes bacterium]|nr:hypothetical protein [Bacillota bacterium]
MDLGFLTSINLLLYIILGLGILMGLLRGMKKTLFAFVTMLIFYIVFFLTINQASLFLWKLNMPWLGGILSNIDSSLSTFTSFEASIGQIVQFILGETVDVSANAELLVLASGIGLFAVKIIYSILYFTVILLIYKLICFILSSIILGKAQKGESKNRGFGALFGALNGVMAVFVTLIMLGGIMSVAESVTTLIASTESTTPLAFQTRDEILQLDYSVIPLADVPSSDDLNLIIEDLQAMVTEYNNNFLVKLADSITVTSASTGEEIALHLNLFDSILSFEYNDEVIAFRYELAVYAEVLGIFLESDYFDTQVLSDITGDEIRDAFASLSKSNLIISVLPLAIEVGADMYDQELPITTLELYAIDFEAELANLGVIAGTLFDILNGAGIIAGDGGVEDIVVGGDMVRGLFGDFSDSSLMVLLTSSVLVPMLEDSDSGISAIISVPADLDWESEFIAIGEVLGAVLDADVSIADLQEVNMTIFLNAAASIDLTVLMNSVLITNALVNILSGNTDIEGLDILIIPSGVEWYDTLDAFGNVIENGELRNVLIALNALATVAGDVDFENFGLNTISEMDDDTIDDLFNSRVFVATISDMLLSQDLGDTPLIIPDTVFDIEGYLLKEELKALSKSIILILSDSETETGFDVAKALTLSSLELDTFLDSEIISATIGKMVVDIDSDQLIVPSEIIVSILVNEISQDVVSATEIKNFILGLHVMGITNFDTIDLEDTSALMNNIEEIIPSKIIHATISNQILGISSSIITIPYEDELGTPISYDVFETTYITSDELTAFMNALDLIGITNPTEFSNVFSLTDLILETDQDTLLTSAIMQATISKTLFDLGDEVLLIPQTKDDAISLLRVESGPLGFETEFVVKSEIKALINALIAMEYSDLSSFGTSIDSAKFFEESDTILLSSSMQATLSYKMLNDTSGNLVVPDEDVLSNTIRIPLVDVEYITIDELGKIIDALDLLGLNDLTTFTISPTLLFTMDFNDLLDSSTMQATVSKYLLDNALDETAPVGSTSLLVPTILRETINVDLVATEQIEKTESIKLLDGLKVLDIENFTDDVDSSLITTLTHAELITLLSSGSMHSTIDNMLRGNTNINTFIPALAETSLYGIPVITLSDEIIAFIEAANILTGPGADFMTVEVDYLTIAGLSETDRNIVLNSMIVRNITTDQLEAVMLADPDPYWPADADYEDPLDPAGTFLTAAGITNVLTHWGLI